MTILYEYSPKQRTEISTSRLIFSSTPLNGTGEGVPYFDEACRIASEAEIMVVVGTSLNVYPAASLIHYAPKNCPIYFVDPGQPEFGMWADRITHIRKKATEGVPELVEQLLKENK